MVANLFRSALMRPADTFRLAVTVCGAADEVAGVVLSIPLEA
jgi:hypothetical protein